MSILQKFLARLLTALLFACPTAFAQQGATPTQVKIVSVHELSGAGATTGTNFHAGLTLAASEINAAGGVLGRQIVLTAYDTQGNPGIAKAMVAKAVDDDPYVIMGPAYSGSAIIAMTESRRARIPNFTAAEAASITQQGNPYIFRTAFSQANSMPRLVRYLDETIQAKSVAILWMNTEFGKGGRDLIVPLLAARGIKVAADIAIEQGQVDFSSAVVRTKQANADVLFPYVTEEEGARLLRELRKQSFDKPIIGETTIAEQKVIELAGEAAEGIRAHVGLTPDGNPRLRAFVLRFEKAHGFKPNHNGVKGYIALYTMKAVTEKIGRFDRAAFTQAMKNVRLSVQDEPNLLMDVVYDDQGNLDRESFLVEVRNGRQEVIAILPPLNP